MRKLNTLNYEYKIKSNGVQVVAWVEISSCYLSQADSLETRFVDGRHTP